MDTENNHRLQLRIAIAGILAAVGSAFMSRLPQLLPGQQAIPWYESGFFWTGIAIVVIALLILIVSPKRWKGIGRSVWGFPKWLQETYIWYRYGPKCILQKPVIDFELYPDDQMMRYSAKVFLTVFVSEKTRKYCPVRCSFGTMRFQLKQKHGMVPLNALLELNPLLGTEILLTSSGNTTHSIGLSWFPYNNPAVLFLDTNKPYTWEIKDVNIYLDNLQKYRKLSRKGRVSNTEKAQ